MSEAFVRGIVRQSVADRSQMELFEFAALFERFDGPSIRRMVTYPIVGRGVDLQLRTPVRWADGAVICVTTALVAGSPWSTPSNTGMTV